MRHTTLLGFEEGLGYTVDNHHFFLYKLYNLLNLWESFLNHRMGLHHLCDRLSHMICRSECYKGSHAVDQIFSKCT